jgi:hypothetical protein
VALYRFETRASEAHGTPVIAAACGRLALEGDEHVVRHVRGDGGEHAARDEEETAEGAAHAQTSGNRFAQPCGRALRDHPGGQ